MATNFQVIRIPELPNLEEKAGTLYIPTYKVDDDTTYRILVDLLGGATDTAVEWESTENYAEGVIVEWNLKLWKSKIDNNQGNTPAENEYWTEVSKAEGGEGINYWNAGVYTNNPTIVVYDKNLYLLNNSEVTMPFESSDFQLELTQNKWLQLTGNDIDAFVGTGALYDPVGTVDDVNDTVTIQQNQFVVYEDGRFSEKTIPEKTLNLTLESEQFVIVKKVSGEWVYDITTSVGDIDATHIAAIPVLTINYYTLDTVKTAHVIDWNSQAINGVNREIDLRVKEKRFRRLEGLGVSINASREVTVSAAKIAYGLNKKEIPDANSVTGKMWQIVWNGTSWDFTEVTTINNTQYQGDTGLVDLANNEYGCYFLFRGVEEQEHLYVMFGSDSFSIVDAREQDFPPDWPEIIESHAIPVARIIYEKNSNDAEIRLAYGGVLSPAGAVTGSSVTVHGNLTGRSESNQHPAAAIQDNAERPNLGTPNPSDLPAVLSAIDSKIGGIDSSLWEPDTFAAATTEHPRWDDSGDPNIYGIDKFGFNLLPAGSRQDAGFNSLGSISDLWSSSESGASGLGRRTYSYNDVFQQSIVGKQLGYSIRLVRPYDPADGDKIDGRILPGTFTDGDGNTYDGVIIGDQVWSTTNLKTTAYANGDPITTGLNDTDWSNATSGAYAVYDYTLVTGIDSESEMISFYGLLYNWYAVDDSRGLSSDGHVPTDAEFTQLTDYITNNYPDIDSTNIGDHLKSVRQVNSPYEAESDEFIKPKVNELTGEQRYVGTEHLKPKIRTETSAFNLQSGDEGARIRYTAATDINVTCFNSLEMFQPITIEQSGSGIITIVGDTGVTVQGLNGGIKTPGQYGYIQVEKVADNVINVIGGIA